MRNYKWICTGLVKTWKILPLSDSNGSGRSNKESFLSTLLTQSGYQVLWIVYLGDWNHLCSREIGRLKKLVLEEIRTNFANIWWIHTQRPTMASTKEPRVTRCSDEKVANFLLKIAKFVATVNKLFSNPKMYTSRQCLKGQNTYIKYLPKTQKYIHHSP